MSLLALEHATKRFSTKQRETVALRDVSLVLDPGECVAVCGLRRSGRTTLLQVAAGLLALDDGVARFDGCDLAGRRPAALGAQIGYCDPHFDPALGGTVADHVAVALLARGAGRPAARVRAGAALERAGAGDCAGGDPRALQPGERVRAGIARALVMRPRLLLLDEPARGVELSERERLLALVRSLAGDGTAVLMTSAEPIAGVDRMLALDRGRLREHGASEVACVVPLRREAGSS